ncbi:MAG: YiiD C-terminal domain-containing protein [Campylobacteraceae bacterium]|nr:YiiD C-terminal domain-containing protein [Campylobacteraceae bacterium]
MKIEMNEVLEYIQKNIPITKELGVSISKYTGDLLVIDAPLAANINHKNSAFGGSLSSIAILSAWALLFVKQKELKLDVTLVIQESKFSFLLPVLKDFQALAYTPKEEDFSKFLKILNKKGKARLKIYSEIICDGRVCGTHEGSYVAIKNK